MRCDCVSLYKLSFHWLIKEDTRRDVKPMWKEHAIEMRRPSLVARYLPKEGSQDIRQSEQKSQAINAVVHLQAGSVR